MDFSKYDFDFEPGATEELIQRLINFAGGELPDDYLNFLRFSNGAFGTYIYIYPIDEVMEYSKTDWVKEDIPGLLVIGSNGGGEAYGYNLNTKPPQIVMTPYIGGRWKNAISYGISFRDFLAEASNKQP